MFSAIEDRDFSTNPFFDRSMLRTSADSRHGRENACCQDWEDLRRGFGLRDSVYVRGWETTAPLLSFLQGSKEREHIPIESTKKDGKEDKTRRQSINHSPTPSFHPNLRPTLSHSSTLSIPPSSQKTSRRRRSGLSSRRVEFERTSIQVVSLCGRMMRGLDGRFYENEKKRADRSTSREESSATRRREDARGKEGGEAHILSPCRPSPRWLSETPSSSPVHRRCS